MTPLRGNYLAVLGGADRDVIRAIPEERFRFVAMGGILLTTAAVSALSMYYALHNAIRLPVIAAIIICLFWGFLILNIDRFLVISIGVTRGAFRLISLAISRLLLSAVTAFVMATPLVIQIFSASINEQIAISHLGKPGPADNGLLAQIQALSNLSSSNAAVEWAIICVTVLLFLISMLPVTTKILLNLGPLSTYELLIKDRNDAAIHRAEQERVLSRHLEQQKLDVRLQIEKDMRAREANLGRHANAHVADQMQSILDAALSEWSNRVRAQLGNAAGASAPPAYLAAQPSQPGTGPYSRITPPHDLSDDQPSAGEWGSPPAARQEARPGYNLPDDDLL